MQSIDIACFYNSHIYRPVRQLITATSQTVRHCGTLLIVQKEIKIMICHASGWWLLISWLLKMLTKKKNKIVNISEYVFIFLFHKKGEREKKISVQMSAQFLCVIGAGQRHSKNKSAKATAKFLNLKGTIENNEFVECSFLFLFYSLSLWWQIEFTCICLRPCVCNSA